jgi:predicted NBD/HSP70 family sugar kinase
MEGANNSRIIKYANRHLLLDTIKKYEPITIENMVHMTRLSRPTVLNILNGLIKRGIVEKVGFAESSGGRQPTLFSFNLSQHFAIGIDFEFPPVRLVISDLMGNAVLSRNWECRFDMNQKEIIDILVDNIRIAITSLNITAKNIIGIGLGIPGTINIKANRSEIISRIPEWNKTPISTIIEKELNIPVYVRNDAHLLALGVQQQLKLEETDFMYIAYRAGIGAAILKNGVLSEGEFGNAGYIGHTILDVNGDLCNCGQRGCLETFSSKRTIEYQYAQVRSLDTRISFNTLLELCDQGDVVARDLFGTAGKYLGVAIANSAKLLDISTVIIGDLNCSKDHHFMRSIIDTVNAYSANYSADHIKVLHHAFTDQAQYALGSALFVTDRFFTAPQLRLSV